MTLRRTLLGRRTARSTGSDDTTFRAVVLDGAVPADAARLARLRRRRDVVVLDHTAGLRAELAELRPAPGDAESAAPAHWAWLPWRRTLVSVPAPRAYRQLRLDRNRNKITQSEQDAYGRLRIGVVGLSVGHAIAYTLAQEGLCGSLRLADMDTIELSNLNRIPASVCDLGINKAVVVARRIAELDPYLNTEVFPGGLTEESMSEFFDGLDIIIEECDSLDIKVRIREEARRRGIPVLMETSDRGLFDVERFDLEPERPLFHGLLGDVAPAELRGLSTNDKAPHVMRILQTADLSARMAASMVEIDRTVSTWPQLAGDVQLGGATVAAAVRRLGPRRGPSVRPCPRRPGPSTGRSGTPGGPARYAGGCCRDCDRGSHHHPADRRRGSCRARGAARTVGRQHPTVDVDPRRRRRRRHPPRR